MDADIDADDASDHFVRNAWHKWPALVDDLCPNQIAQVWDTHCTWTHFVQDQGANRIAFLLNTYHYHSALLEDVKEKSALFVRVPHQCSTALGQEVGDDPVSFSWAVYQNWLGPVEEMHQIPTQLGLAVH